MTAYNCFYFFYISVSGCVKISATFVGRESVLISIVRAYVTQRRRSHDKIRNFTQNTTATATRTSPNKRFNELNNGCARAL